MSICIAPEELKIVDKSSDISIGTAELSAAVFCTFKPDQPDFEHLMMHTVYVPIRFPGTCRTIVRQLLDTMIDRRTIPKDVAARITGFTTQVVYIGTKPHVPEERKGIL